MKLTLVFSRKCTWPEHYFSVECLRNSQKLLTTNQVLVSKIFFTIYEYFFLRSAFWSLFNHCQTSQSNQEQCSLCCSSPCLHVLLWTHYESLQCFSTEFRKWKEIRVLRSMFPLLFFVNMMEYIEINWLLKYMNKVRSSQAYISIDSCTELSKNQFYLRVLLRDLTLMSNRSGYWPKCYLGFCKYLETRFSKWSQIWWKRVNFFSIVVKPLNTGHLRY